MLCCWDLMTMSLTEIGGGEMERRVTCLKRVLLLHTRDRDITLIIMKRNSYQIVYFLLVLPDENCRIIGRGGVNTHYSSQIQGKITLILLTALILGTTSPVRSVICDQVIV